MPDYKTAAYACFIACEDKTRRFFYNEDGVFEGIWNGYDKIAPKNFKTVVGEFIPIQPSKFDEFYRSLKWGHDVFAKDKSVETRDTPLYGGGNVSKPINLDAA